ncbi:MAG TPA: hypothetical protein VF134_08880 [Candidatus Dormibacteraeota bacterium]
MRWLGARLLIGGLAAAVTLSPAASAPVTAASSRVLLVGTYNGIPGQYTSIQAAVNAAHPNDWILVGPGVYHEYGSNDPNRPAGVLIQTQGIWLRGMDRNRVILDGTKPNSHGPCSSQAADQELGPATPDGPAGRSGIVVYKTSGTYVENLTVCNFLTGARGQGNEIWWNGGDGSGSIGMTSYWGNYLTATSTYSNGVYNPRGEYGIYANNVSGPGSINHTYASNMGDAAYYIGACPNCNSVLADAHAQFSALGYSGTNSGGNLVIRDSEFDHNLSGIVSNSQNNDDQPPPEIGLCPPGSKPPVAGAVGCTVFMHNNVHDNNNPNVPGAGNSGLAGSAPVGAGIVLAGTRYITLYQNDVHDNGAWGVLVADLPDPESAPPGFPNCTGGTWAPAAGICYYDAFGNYTWANTFRNNGGFGNPSNGDIGLATTPHDPGNCFNANTDPDQPGGQPTSDPPNIQSPPYNPCGLPNGGDMGVLAAEALCATQLLAPCPNLPGLGYPRTTGVTLSMPPPQPTMPNPCAGVPPNPWCPKT